MAVIRATEDSDSVIGTSGRDVLQGDDDDNYLDGMAGRDWVFGNGGNDILIFDNTDQMLHGGEGFDTLRFLTGNQTANLAEKPVVNSIEAIDFASSGNRLTLTAADIERMSDNDALVITGGAGNTIDPGTGWQYDGLSNDQRFYKFSQGSISMNVETGVLIKDFTPPPTIEIIEGDDGDNTLASTTSGGKIFGYGGNDTLTSNFSFTSMEGGLGKDTLSGYGTGDTLNGGDGDDTLTGYGGGNFLAGGDGNDTLSITGSGSGDMRGGAGNDSLFLTTNGGAIAFGDEGADKFNLRYGPSNVIFRINDFEASAGDTIVVSSTLGDLTNISQLQLVQADPSNSILYQLSYLSPLPDPSFPPMERVIAEIIWVDPSPPVISSSIFSIGVL